MFGGSVLAWGLIGPLLVHYGVCIGKPAGGDDPKWAPLMSFTSLSKIGAPGWAPSPRYWLLWPGVMIMVCVSLAELFIQYKIIGIAFKSLFQSACSGLQEIAQRRGKTVPFFAKHGARYRNANIVEDPTRPEDQVKDWMWILGLLVTIVIAMIICQLQWVSSYIRPHFTFRDKRLIRL